MSEEKEIKDFGREDFKLLRKEIVVKTYKKIIVRLDEKEQHITPEQVEMIISWLRYLNAPDR